MSIKNISHTLGSFTDFKALFQLVSMNLQKLKKKRAIRLNWSYTSKLVVFNHVGSCLESFMRTSLLK